MTLVKVALYLLEYSRLGILVIRHERSHIVLHPDKASELVETALRVDDSQWSLPLHTRLRHAHVTSVGVQERPRLALLPLTLSGTRLMIRKERFLGHLRRGLAVVEAGHVDSRRLTAVTIDELGWLLHEAAEDVHRRLAIKVRDGATVKLVYQMTRILLLTLSCHSTQVFA